MVERDWRAAVDDLILKVPLIWFTNVGIRLALTILFMPVVAYLLYPTIAPAFEQLFRNAH